MSTFDPKSTVADVLVIGAGGAGLLAAIAAAKTGVKTVLLERMKTPAKKVAISGGGRCNFTNTLDPRQFVRLFGDENAGLLGHALRAFSNNNVIDLLGQYGVEGQVERNYRLYTKSGRGGDVVRALVTEFEKHGGVLVLNARVTGIIPPAASTPPAAPAAEPVPGAAPANTSDAFILRTQIDGRDAPLRAKTVIVCTGGLSYPVTGSTGDGYDWARLCGHNVTKLRPALVGMSVDEAWAKTLQGLAWDDAAVSLYPYPPVTGSKKADTPPPVPQGKPLCVERAEILFTHFGISGPAILDVSNVFVRHELKRGILAVDFMPDVTREALDAQLQEKFKQHPNRQAARALEGMLPARLLEYLERSLGPDSQTAVCRLPKAARLKLLDGFKRLLLTAIGTREMEFGEVTAGGIEWDRVEPRTMESKLVPGLFFAGEVLDLAGRCGGFNLQAAFSTGYLAGLSAAKKSLPAPVESTP